MKKISFPLVRIEAYDEVVPGVFIEKLIFTALPIKIKLKKENKRSQFIGSIWGIVFSATIKGEIV